MIENSNEDIDTGVNNGMLKDGEKLHLRWNSHRGRIFIDGSHLTHNLELGDEIMIDNQGTTNYLCSNNSKILFLIYLCVARLFSPSFSIVYPKARVKLKANFF